jgi:hypothetical protein
MAKHVALLVGWTGYGDGRLTAPHDGATLAALAEALRRPQNGRFHTTRLLIDQTAVETQLSIAAFLEQPYDPDDLLLLYLSGHCLLVGEETLLAASDAFSEPYLDATTIQAEFIRRRLRQCPARVLLVLDVVHSRADAAPEADSLPDRAFAAPEYALILAGRVADQPPPPISLTQALTAGLRELAGEKQEANGRLTLQKWFAHAAAQLPSARKQASAAQGEWEIVPGVTETAVPPTPPTNTSKRPTLLALALLALLLLLFGGLYAANNQPAAVDQSPTTTSQLALISETATPTHTATPQPTPQPTPQLSPTSGQPPATSDQPPATATATATTLPRPHPHQRQPPPRQPPNNHPQPPHQPSHQPPHQPPPPHPPPSPWKLSPKPPFYAAGRASTIGS